MVHDKDDGLRALSRKVGRKSTAGLTSCFGSAGPTRLELALIAFVDGIEGPMVTQVAVPDDERGIRLDQFEVVCAACWTGHGEGARKGRVVAVSEDGDGEAAETTVWAC